MIFGDSFLPTDLSRYELHNAAISNGVMQIAAGGSVTCAITANELPAIPESLCLYLYADILADKYTPRTYAIVSAAASDGTRVSTTIPILPVEANGVFSAIFSLYSGTYETFTFELYSAVPLTITLWELCGEITDTSGLTTIIDGVEQSLPKMLYDVNTTRIQVEQAEKTVGLINLQLLGDTDLQGNFLMAYRASQPCTITLRFKDNDVTELFAPLLYQVAAGVGTIGVPHAYVRRRSGGHSLRVTAQVSAGTLTIETRGLLYSIDGGYLATRVADAGADIRDVAIRQVSAANGPDTLYVVGIEDGRAFIRSKPYSALASGAFDPLYGLDEAKHAAIEFNGEWVLRGTSIEDRDDYLIITHDDGISIVPITTEYNLEYSNNTLLLYINAEIYYNIIGDNVYTLLTEDMPYCFWSNEAGELYVQHGNGITTRTLLDIGVDGISVCRGYKSVVYHDLDQGLICLYVKNGEAYYRSYCYNEATNAFLWEQARKVDGIVGTVTHVQVHRLNDFRIGFAVTTTLNNYWLISSRTYVGQSVLPEHFEMNTSEFYSAVAMLPADVVHLPLALSERLDASGRIIYIDSNYPLRCIDEPSRWLSLSDNALRISSVQITSSGISIVLSSPVTGSATVNILGHAVWQYSLDGAWKAVPAQSLTLSLRGYAYETFTIGIAAASLTPTMRQIITTANSGEETFYITTASAMAVIQMRAITTVPNASEETFTVGTSQATASIVVTQVGVIPV